MNVVLLSGGSGQRLWPLSNNIRSKQFVKLFKREDGEYESMIQRVCRQIRTVDSNIGITIATSKMQVSTICNQVQDEVDVCVEPLRRDTFPAIVLACAYLKDCKHISEEEIVIVCPVDPYVDESYFEMFAELEQCVKKNKSNLTLMGVIPTYPSEKYGYIIPEHSAVYSKAKEFKEKPDADTAELYIKQGALWNCGVFAFKLSYLLEVAHKKMQFCDYYDLYQNYSKQKKISFDYAVVENESSVGVLRYSGTWKDIGTWNTFSEEMAEDIIGKGVMDNSCINTKVINELDIPILCMGLHETIVVASNDGILVTDKDRSAYLKSYVEAFSQNVMYAEKSWGNFTVLDVGENEITVKIIMVEGHAMNYHSHSLRDEIWNIISGNGKVMLDGNSRNVKSGDVIQIPRGMKHMIIAESELQIIEIQIGEVIDVKDKKKYNLRNNLDSGK